MQEIHGEITDTHRRLSIPMGDPPEIPTGDPSEGRVPEWAVWAGGPGAGLVCTQLFRVNHATFFEGIWENA